MDSSDLVQQLVEARLRGFAVGKALRIFLGVIFGVIFRSF